MVELIWTALATTLWIFGSVCVLPGNGAGSLVLGPCAGKASTRREIFSGDATTENTEPQSCS
jgi:hypothetical protein